MKMTRLNTQLAYTRQRRINFMRRRMELNILTTQTIQESSSDKKQFKSEETNNQITRTDDNR
jgi:hypothetical protein